MQSGVTFAKAHGLRPGVALSAAQVAQLTSDLVWLVSEAIHMPDGSVQTVLVPKVYVVAKAGDLSASGTLLSADVVNVKTDGDVHNSGTIADRKAVLITCIEPARSVDAMSSRVQLHPVRHPRLHVLGLTVGSWLHKGFESGSGANDGVKSKVCQRAERCA